MLKWSLIFFVITLITGGLGFTSMPTWISGAARILFFMSLAIFIIFVMLAIMAGEILA